MTKPDAKPETKPETANLPAVSADAQAAERVKALKDQIRTLEAEIRSMRGKIANRTSENTPKLKRENQELKARFKNLERALLGTLIEGFKPRQADDCKQQVEVLRLAAIEYCKEAKIDPELWKNIAY